jgi:hypothetical protein
LTLISKEKEKEKEKERFFHNAIANLTKHLQIQSY